MIALPTFNILACQVLGLYHGDIQHVLYFILALDLFSEPGVILIALLEDLDRRYVVRVSGEWL